MTVDRLRWWHRINAWESVTGWVYTWERPNWVGTRFNPAGEVFCEVIHLRPDLDTADYGPFKRTLI